MIVAVERSQSFDQPAEGRSLGFSIRLFFEIEIVNDPTDPQDPRVGNLEAIAERLERAERSVVAKLGVKGIERNNTRDLGGITEHEGGFGIDKPSNQPGRRHAINAGTRTGQPSLAAIGDGFS